MANKKSKPKQKDENGEQKDQSSAQLSENNERPYDDMQQEMQLLREELGRLHDDMHQDIKLLAERQIAKAHRRRRWSNFFHDVVIVALVAVAVYFGYCLYDARYFSFLKTSCEKDGTCKVEQSSSGQSTGDNTTGNTSDGTSGSTGGTSSGANGSTGGTSGSASGANGGASSTTAGPVKDETWYLANYRYLYDRLNLRADADNVSAYYLYSGDFAVLELKAETRLAMAYNQLENRNLLNVEPAVKTVDIPEADLLKAYQITFGTSDGFVQASFVNGCLQFNYDKTSLSFTAQNTVCERNVQREILEEIERIFADGEAIYVVTVAGVFDKNSQMLYNFDNLFRPAAVGLGSAKITASELKSYSAVLNRYQYKFVKNGDDYKFAGITKLQ